ncbi:uncharacterized protein LOC122296792 [Carya illinoinensis]|uniref:uncharacterized protein LOC122296792 n=1 Tax=Carya illinoinensis TaxID=32201 RepID=UPI001C727E92|nr:uncharacterized protein LOC122296792 [Carya illinoinensis]
MKHLAWNCRGLGNPRTVRELHLLVKEKSPDIIFLSETKCRRERIEKIRDRLKYACSFSVDSRGRSGGLAFIWKEGVEADLDSYSQSHISLLINASNSSLKRTLTGFYGQPITAKRSESWDLLRLIHSRIQTPWLCMGDFNEIMYQDEKFGFGTRPFKQMEEFRLALVDCGLMDTGFIGSIFTWCNKREGLDLTKSRLDRALINEDWENLFDINQTHVLPGQCSDHNPLLIHSVNSKQEVVLKRRLFKYEVAWGNREGCKELIKEVWRQRIFEGTKLKDTRARLEGCREKL